MGTTRVGFWTLLWPTRHRLGHKWLVLFNAGKTQFFVFVQCSNFGAIYVKIDESVLERNFFLRSWDWSFSSKLDWCSYIGSIAKIDWFVIWNFFLLRLLFISLNLPYSLVWNTVVMCVAPSCYLNLLDKLLKRLCSTDFLEPFAHHRKSSSFNLFFFFL